MSFLIKNDMNGDVSEFSISERQLEQTNIPDTYIGGVQLITYNSPEDEMHASNWKADIRRLKNDQLFLVACEVILIALAMLSIAAGGILMGVAVGFGGHGLIAGLCSGGFLVFVGALVMGLAKKLEHNRTYSQNTERRTKKIEESEEKLIEHFSRLTTGSFDEVYEKYQGTPHASNSKLEALVRAHLLMPSEAVIWNKLFEIQSDPKAATVEERNQLEVAKGAFHLLQADLAIARLNQAPAFEHTDKPHTDPSDWPLFLEDEAFPPAPTFTYIKP